MNMELFFTLIQIAAYLLNGKFVEKRKDLKKLFDIK